MKNSIVCPKCKNKTLVILDKEDEKNLREYCECFCNTCRLYFGWRELSKYWNIDIGDFYDVDAASEPEFEDWETYLKSQFGYKYLFMPSQFEKVVREVTAGYPVGAVGGS